MLNLLQNPLSIKFSDARESIIALIVIYLVVPCSRIVTILWLFSLFSLSALCSAASRFLMSMDFDLVLSLRPLLTGYLCCFPILLPLQPPFLLLWLLVSIAFC